MLVSEKRCHGHSYYLGLYLTNSVFINTLTSPYIRNHNPHRSPRSFVAQDAVYTFITRLFFESHIQWDACVSGLDRVLDVAFLLLICVMSS